MYMNLAKVKTTSKFYVCTRKRMHVNVQIQCLMKLETDSTFYLDMRMFICGHILVVVSKIQLFIN